MANYKRKKRPQAHYAHKPGDADKYKREQQFGGARMKKHNLGPWEDMTDEEYRQWMKLIDDSID